MKMKKISQIKSYGRQEKGITLIALIITIIVLSILAGISIGMVTGDNGLIKKTISTTDETNQLIAEEKVETEVANSYGKNGNIDLDKLNENLKNNIKGIEFNNSPISDSNKIESLPATVVVDGYEVEIKDEITAEIPEPFKYGDVDQNGSVTINDATVIQDYVKGLVTLTDTQKKAADVSGDGKITMYDAIIIQVYIAERMSAFPAEDPNVEYCTPGDVDENGVVDEADIQLIYKYLNEEVAFDEIQIMAADFNKDGYITEDDINEIRKVI